MLSRAGDSRLGLVCSDCGTPLTSSREHDRPHPVVTGLTLLAMATFSLLLFFLTNWRPLPAPQAAKQRTLIRQLTTGEFVREQEPIEKGAQAE
jgi:hypothetical protein